MDESISSSLKLPSKTFNIYQMDYEYTINAGGTKKQEDKLLTENTVKLSQAAKRIDYVLVYRKSIKDAADTEEMVMKQTQNALTRKKFLRALENEGFELHFETIKKDSYVKLHLDFQRLCKEAEKVKLKMPLHGCMIYNEEHGGCLTKFEEKYLETDNEGNQIKIDFVSATFQRDFLHIYEGYENEETFFRPSVRSYLAHHILISMDIRDSTMRESTNPRQGLPYLLHHEVFKDAFTLHCQTADDPSEREEIEYALALKGESMTSNEKRQRRETKLAILDARKELDDLWLQMCKYQPLWKIRNYFGEKIGLYFAWLGLLISSLWIPAILGVGVFIYGIYTSFRDHNHATDTANGTENGTDSEELTEQMTAGFEAFKNAFDNDATPWFALVICLWGTIFLELWKRKRATLAYEWDVDNFEASEPDRPEFYGTSTKPDPISMEATWIYPMSRYLMKFATSASILLIMVIVVCVSVGAVILYRVIMTIDYCGKLEATECAAVTTVASSVLNAISILLLGRVYVTLAQRLTNWENHRTQSSYDDALILKLFAFQFANSYASLFYIAFFRDMQHPDGMFGLGSKYQDTCGTITYNEIMKDGELIKEASLSKKPCMPMLSFQVLTVMIIKPFPKLFTDVIIPTIKRKWRKRTACRKSKKVSGSEEDEIHPTPYLAREKAKPPLGDFTLDEYTEKVILFGYLVLFAASFSLAPLIFIIVALLDIRVDASRMLWMFKRPISEVRQDIGMWYNILQFISIVGVLSNACLIAFTSSWGSKYSNENRLWIVILFENAVLAIKFLLAVMIPDTPTDVTLAANREKFQINKIMSAAVEAKLSPKHQNQQIEQKVSEKPDLGNHDLAPNKRAEDEGDSVHFENECYTEIKKIKKRKKKDTKKRSNDRKEDGIKEGNESQEIRDKINKDNSKEDLLNHKNRKEKKDLNNEDYEFTNRSYDYSDDTHVQNFSI